MNPRTFRNDGHYYSLEPPWCYANHHVFDRIFQLKTAFGRIERSLEELDRIRESCYDNGIDAISFPLDITKHILHLMESAEVFEYNFQELAEASWFGGFTQDVAHAYWRIEDGQFDDAHRDKEALDLLLGEIDDILSNTSNSQNQGVINRLYEFFNYYAMDLYPNEVSDNYHADVFEARDLYCLGYYSTALLVMGRAVEKSGFVEILLN